MPTLPIAVVVGSPLRGTQGERRYLVLLVELTQLGDGGGWMLNEEDYCPACSANNAPTRR